MSCGIAASQHVILVTLHVARRNALIAAVLFLQHIRAARLGASLSYHVINFAGFIKSLSLSKTANRQTSALTEETYEISPKFIHLHFLASLFIVF
jgi:hypothetical protein